MSLLGKIYYSYNNYVSGVKKDKHIKKIISDFINYYSESSDPEIMGMVSFYKSGKIRPFPYPFIEKYIDRDVEVYRDENIGLQYVLHRNKKIYFPRGFQSNSIARMYNNLCAEQDSESPHLYTKADSTIIEGDVIIDIGCADGLFTLDNIEQAKKAYLFESDECWIEALRATFNPWINKTEIIKGFVSNINEGDFITLDGFMKNRINNGNCFMKIDVEGHEKEVILGASEFLSNKNRNIRMAVASYHRQSDYECLNDLMMGIGFKTTSSNGYILFYYDENILPPYIRKCIIMAENSCIQ